MTEYGQATDFGDPVGINDLSVWDTEVEYDPDASLTQTIVCPDNVRPIVKLKLGRRGLSPADLGQGPMTDKNGTKYVMAHVEAHVIAPGEFYDNAVIFDTATSLVFKSGTSKIHSLLKAVGKPVSAKASLREIYTKLQEAFAGNAECRVRGNWSASVRNLKWREGMPKSEKYAEKLKKMRDFPQRADGSFNPVVEIDGETVTAQFNVRDYLAIG